MKNGFTYLFIFIYFLPILSAQDCTVKRYKQRVFENIDITTDLIYGQADPYDALGSSALEDLALDFYEPVGDDLEQRPLVISCYGGAFLFGTKEDSDVQAWCDSLTRRGYACAAINYRLGLNPTSERSAYRAVYRAVQDLRAAIRYLLEDPDNLGFNVDPDNIFVEGQSAGAITAIHTAFLTTAERPIETFAFALSIDEGSDLGCLDCSGNTFVQPVSIKGILSMWGAVESLDFIDTDENTPMLMVHGDSDPVVPYGTGRPFNSPFFPEVHGSSIMAPWLTGLGIYNEFYPYENDMSHTVYGEPIAMTFPQDSWFDIFEDSQQFLYHLIRFDNPLPSGNTTVNPGESHIYSITPNSNSTYCWTVEGGTITADNGDNIMVLWDNVAQGTVSVQEKNYFDLLGEANPLTVDINTSLPIVWTTFTGQQNGTAIHLNWEVENEVNFSHYNVQKSSDGKHFSTILKQEKKEPLAGKVAYELIDHQPLRGLNYYRLQAVDKDGKLEYSEVVVVDFSAFWDLKIWMDSDVRLSFYSQAAMDNLVQVVDVQGRIVFEQDLTSIVGQNEWRLPFAETRSGVYILKIGNRYGESAVKLLVN